MGGVYKKREKMWIIYLIPIIGTILILGLEEKNKIKKIALFTTILTLIVNIIIFILWDSKITTIVRIGSIMGIEYGIDGISLIYMLLTTLIMPICVLVSWNYINQNIKLYYSTLIILELLLLLVFSVLDVLGFYIYYESVLIPMYIIIGIYGARQEKIKAAYYFFYYTLAGSILMLISIIYLFITYGTTNYFTLLSLIPSNLPLNIENLLFLGFFMGLAVKIPKFPFHIWLPLAHVEAPLAGSILLAGILIKLGSYGFIRYVLVLFPNASLYFTPFIYVLAVLGIIYASLTTLRQTDLKRIIANSSISQMGYVMLGIFSNTTLGIEGSIILQVAHGLVSSGLFIIVTLIYERHHTRILKYYRGLSIVMPLWASAFLFLTLANIGFPLTCNFIGEFSTLVSTLIANTFIGILASSGMVFSAAYALFLFNRISFGSLSPYVSNTSDITRREIYILLPLILLTLILGITPSLLFDPIHLPVQLLLS